MSSQMGHLHGKKNGKISAVVIFLSASEIVRVNLQISSVVIFVQVIICDGWCSDEVLTLYVMPSIVIALYQHAIINDSHRYIAIVIDPSQPETVAVTSHRKLLMGTIAAY